MSISKSEKSTDVDTRLANLDAHFTFSLYNNICRSLLEKDKLLFSFLLTMRIMKSKGQIDEQEWMFLLTGGVMLNNPHANPAPEWLSPKSWNEMCTLDSLENFKGLKDEVMNNTREWKKIYDSTEPHKLAFPGKLQKLGGVQRLCLLRTIRSDKVIFE